MTAEPLLLLGAGGHARVCIDVIEQAGNFSILGLTGLAEEVGSRLLGYLVAGTDAHIEQMLGDAGRGLVAVGQIKTPEPRMRLFGLLEARDRVVPAIVSPRAYVSPHATVGEGSIVMHGAVVNAGARVGRNCIVNSQALIEHDAVVADHCHISTGAILNSGVRINEGVFVGSNSTVRQGISIGTRCVIGMAQAVLKDCADGTWLPPARRLS